MRRLVMGIMLGGLILFQADSLGADAGEAEAEVSGIKNRISALEKNDQEIEDLKQLVGTLTDRINKLEEENRATRVYAQELEAELQVVTAPVEKQSLPAPTVPSVPTRCASTSCRTFLSDIGNMQIGMAATGVLGHVESAEGDENDLASGSVNMYLETPLAANAVFHLNLEGIGGNWDVGRGSLTALNADSGSLQSSDGIDRVQIREAKIQASFWDNALTAYAGKIDPTAYFDGNEGANDETSQFLAGALVNNETFVGTFPGGYVPGAGIYYDLGDYMDGAVVGTGLFSRDNSGNHIFDNLVWVTEIDYACDIAGLPGNYRVYGYCAGQEGGPGGNDDNGIDDDLGVGFGISIDQKIAEDILLFGRFGYNGNDVAAGDLRTNPIANDAVSFGIQFENPFLTAGLDRPGDVLSVGYAQHALFDLATDTTEVGSDYEQLIETYYRYQINGQVAVSPFYQFTRQTGGDDNGDRIHIIGMRSSVEF